MSDQSLIVKLPMPASLLPSQPSPTQRDPALRTTTAQMGPAKLSSHFTQSQLSLALTISKSKPAELSTTEYIQQLRKHIKTGQPVPKEQLRYVDTSGFWMDQYDRIYREKNTLEDRVRCLEEAQRVLKEKLRSSESSDEEDHNVRRREQVQVEREASGRMEAGSSRKRLATSQEVDNADGRGEDSLLSSLENDGHLRLSSYALRIMRQRGQLQKAAKESGTLDQINNLTKRIIQTITILESSISDCCLPLASLKVNSEDSRTLFLLQQVLHQVALSYLACFNAMNPLFLTILGRAKRPEIVYRLVMLFKKPLDILHTINILQAEEERIQRTQNLRSKRARVETAEYAISKYLAQTLASIARDIEWEDSQTGHSEILEGMLFSILEHTGRMISDSVFGEHVAPSNNLGNITNSSNVSMNEVLRPDARYMVQILYAMLGGSDRKELVTRVLSAEQNNHNIQSRSSSIGIREPTVPGDLLSKVKKLLQSTLLKSTVGGAELESLRLPRPPAEGSKFPEQATSAERYGKYWLLETVWGLVGWDMVT